MKLKKDELIEKAKAAGVATSGTKADIVARLIGELNNDAAWPYWRHSYD